MENCLSPVSANELIKCEILQKCHNKHLGSPKQFQKWTKSKEIVDTFTEQYRKSGGKTFQNCHNFKYKRRKYKINALNNFQTENSSIIEECSLNGRYQKSVGSIISRKPRLIYFRLTLCQYVRSAKMLKNSWLTWLMVILAIIMLGFANIVEAGVCWTARESNGKCTQRYSSSMSEEECCKHPNFAYTEREMSDVELFFAAAIDDGAVCKSCLDSCEAAKCGSGKRCVYRKGRPKCVCAPICRSSKQKSRLANNSNSKGPNASKQPASPPPLMLPKEQRPFPSFFNFGAMTESATGDDEVPARNPINSKTSTSINATYKNSAVRWRRESKLNVAEALKLNHNETEHSTLKKRRKNQRKSKTASKSRKQSTIKGSSTNLPIQTGGQQGGDAEEIESDERQHDSPKSGKMIIMASRPEVDFRKTFKQHRKASNSSSSQHSAMHRSRHQSKKDQQRHQSRMNGTSVAGASRQENSPNTVLLLGEKIRNGFFYHGFPYPGSEDTMHAHGQYYNPVCGTDGKTYKTECQLKKRACRRESTTLTVAYRGHCQTSCKQVRCLNNLTCVEDQYGLPHCISCTIACPQDDTSSIIDPAKAVCGADGLTYKSICDINRLICTTGRSIAVAYYGVCQEEANCNTIQCHDKQICLNDLLTNKPRCISCSFKCPRKRRPQGQRYQEHKICGTNNLTYHSWCQMRRESCNTGFYIDVKHIGACQKSSAASSKPKATSS